MVIVVAVPAVLCVCYPYQFTSTNSKVANGFQLYIQGNTLDAISNPCDAILTNIHQNLYANYNKLSTKQNQVWFQNRRAKFRKQERSKENEITSSSPSARETPD